MVADEECVAIVKIVMVLFTEHTERSCVRNSGKGEPFWEDSEN